MLEGIVEFIPEKVLYIRIVLEPGIVTVVERGYGGRDLTLPVQNRNQHVLFVICNYGKRGEGRDVGKGSPKLIAT